MTTYNLAPPHVSALNGPLVRRFPEWGRADESTVAKRPNDPTRILINRSRGWSQSTDGDNDKPLQMLPAPTQGIRTPLVNSPQNRSCNPNRGRAGMSPAANQPNDPIGISTIGRTPPAWGRNSEAPTTTRPNEPSRISNGRSRRGSNIQRSISETERSGEMSTNNPHNSPEGNGTERTQNVIDPQNGENNTNNNGANTDYNSDDDNVESNREEVCDNRRNGQYRCNTHKNKNMANSLKIASLNIKGGSLKSSAKKWKHLNQVVRDQKINILAIQEAHLSDIHLKTIQSLFEKQLIIFNSSLPGNQTASAGVSFIISKSRSNWKSTKCTEIIPGRAILLTLNWTENKEISILNVYAPNASANNANFWARIKEIWREKRLHKPDIMIGDFNMVEEAADRLPSHADPENVSENLIELKTHLRLVDGWRRTFPDTIKYTFEAQGRNIHSRIDRIYLKEQLIPLTINWEISPAPIMTDHKMVSVKIINPYTPEVGHGRWSIPPNIIEKTSFIKEIQEEGIKVQRRITQGNELQMEYKLFKQWVITKAKQRAKISANRIDKKIIDIEKDILMSENDRNKPEDERAIQISILNKELTNIKMVRHERQRNYVAVKNRLEGEQINKYWINLNKAKAPRDTIMALQSENGNLIRISKEMSRLAKTYHQTLQTNDIALTEEQNQRQKDIGYALGDLEKLVTPDMAVVLTEKISNDEIIRTLPKLPKGKSAGIDGIPYELWQKLLTSQIEDENLGLPTFRVSELLLSVFNDIEENGVTPNSGFHTGWMCPLYKKKERSDISNYRPITVLNCDYRLLTRILTTKLALIAPSIIHPDQAGFIKGRQISDQTDLINLIIDYAESYEVNGAIVSLDQEKAYDRIRHDYLWEAMNKIGIPGYFIDNVKHLYKNAETVVILNGEISEPYEVTRGVRQGDPLSCLLFNIAIEALACKLRTSNLIGVTMEGWNDRLIATLFADDTTIFLHNQDNFQELTTILNTWCTGSGARFNIAKTSIIPIGSQEYRNTLLESRKLNPLSPSIPNNIPIIKDNKPVRILGSFMGNNVEPMGIWIPTLETIQSNIERWKKSHPTLEGKRLILNMEIGGRTQYLTRVQGMPKETLQHLQKVTKEFIWNGEKKAEVNMETLATNFEDGGIKCINTEARNEAIDLMKLKRYLCMDESRPRWAHLVDFLLRENAKTNTEINDEGSVTNMFLQNWGVRLKEGYSTIPTPIRKMINTAKKYGTSFDARNLSVNTKRDIPIWHHLGLGGTRTPWNKKEYICLRNKHKIRTTGDIEDFTKINWPQFHKIDNKRCKCLQCQIEKNRGCKHPNKCRVAGINLLDKLPPKWHPAKPQPDETVIQWANSRTDENPGEYKFNPDITITSLKDGFRIITGNHTPSPNPVIRGPPSENPEQIEIYTDGSAIRNGYQNGIAGGGIWIDEGNPLNESISLPGKYNTNNAGELIAIYQAVKVLPKEADITIHTDSQYAITMIIAQLNTMEDQGWIGYTNQELIEPITSLMRTRTGRTTLKKVKAHTGIFGNERADQLAKLAIGNPRPDELGISVPKNMELPGIQLATATQSLIYKAIIERKKIPLRERTFQSLERIKAQIVFESGLMPNDAGIWQSIRNKDISRKTREFMWKTIHGVWYIGKRWTHIPNCEQREYCPQCGVTEDMEHILIDCDYNGSKWIWENAKKLINKAGYQWTNPTVGNVLGISATQYTNDKGKPDQTQKRMRTIIITEAMHLIWKMRCNWVISHLGASDKQPSKAETINRFTDVISRRIMCDILSSNDIIYKSKAVPKSKIARTWSKIIPDKNLWYLKQQQIRGFLVGIFRGIPPEESHILTN